MGSPARTTGSFTREQLVQALDRLQADGRWSPYQAAALLQELDRTVPAVPPPPRRPTGRPHPGSRRAEAAGYAGAVLIGAAGAVLVGQQWETPRPTGPGGGSPASPSSSPRRVWRSRWSGRGGRAALRQPRTRSAADWPAPR